MKPTTHVFISSTWIDLQPERNKVEQVLAGFHETKFSGMEHFGSRDDTTRDTSLAEVDRSDLYIGIFGGRYGSGITHEEYRRARERKRHCLVYLKDEAVIGPDGRDTDPRKAEALQALKDEILANHLVRGCFEGPDQLAAQVAIDLHRWLFDAMRPSALAGYPLLTDYVHDFRPLIERETRWFVGRESVFDSLDNLARKHPCGYLSIVTDAGLGKTALAAAIAARLNAPAFFCSAAENLTRAHQCLEHLCGEIILRYDLAHDHLPARAGEDSSHFSKLLAEAACKAADAGLHLWVVVDGLDEADDLAGGRNPLLLPPTLPSNAFVVTTQRPLHQRLVSQPGTRVQEIVIRAGDAMQRDDMHTYLRNQAERCVVEAARSSASPPIDTESFVRLLANSADGNFKYLEYVIADIIEGQPGYRPFDAAHLPAGLDRYYEQFWARMGLDRAPVEAWDDWNTLYRPVIALLGVAAEPVTADWLAYHSGCKRDEVYARVLHPWRRFLTAEGRPGAETWRIVHKSFADFLESKPELDLAGFHARIALTYLDAEQLPAWHAEYRRRHLAEHLRRGQQLDALFGLIERRDWFDAQFAADPSVTLFLDDVEQGWAAATASAQAGEPLLRREVQCALSAATVHSLSSNLPPGLIAELVRHGVWSTEIAFASIRQMPDKDQALRALAKLVSATSEVASVRKAIDYARGIAPASWRRGEAMAPLAAALARLGRSQEALAELKGTPDCAGRAYMLEAMAPYLDPASIDLAIEEAISVVKSETESPEAKEASGSRTLGHVDQLANVLRHAKPENAESLRRRCEALWDHAWARDRVIHSLAMVLVAAGDVQRAQDWAAEIVHQGERSACFADLVERLPLAQRSELARQAVDDALASLADFPTPKKGRTLARLLSHVPNDVRDSALGAALELVRHGLQKGETLASLVTAFDDVWLERAVVAARELTDSYERDTALVALAGRAVSLQGPLEAMTLATSGRHGGWERSEATVELLPHLVRAGFSDKALDAVRRIATLRPDPFLPKALEAVAPDLPATSIDEALAIADALPDRVGWQRAVQALAERVAGLGQAARALSLLQRIRDDTAVRWRLQEQCALLQARAGYGAAALASLRAIGNVSLRVSTLKAITPVLPDGQVGDAWREIMALHNASRKDISGQPYWDFESGDAALAMLPRVVAASGAQAALALVEVIEESLLRAQCVVMVAEALPAAENDARQVAAVSALEVQLAEDGLSVRAALRDMARYLGEPAVRLALALVTRSRQLDREKGYMSERDLEKAELPLSVQLGAFGHVEEALRYAQGLEPQARVELLALLVPMIPEQQRRPTLEDALRAFDEQYFYYFRDSALEKLAPVLSPETIEPAIALAFVLEKKGERARAMRAIARRWTDIESVTAVLLRALAFEDDAARGGALAGLAPVIDAAELARVAAAMRSVPPDYWSEPLYAALAARLAECDRAEEALALANTAGSHAAPAFAAIAPWLDAKATRQALNLLSSSTRVGGEAARIALAARLVALGEVDEGFDEVDAILNCEERCHGLREAVAALRGNDLAMVHRVWQRALRRAATRRRDEALPELTELLPLAARIGGADVLQEAVTAALGVMTTWP